MPINASSDRPRTILVDLTVHVETFATHQTLMWKAGNRSQFVEATCRFTTPPPERRV